MFEPNPIINALWQMAGQLPLLVIWVVGIGGLVLLVMFVVKACDGVQALVQAGGRAILQSPAEDS